MRAVVYDRFGPPEVLAVREVADPAPRTGEVLVAVRAAALNPKDVLIRKGKMWPFSGRGFPRPTGFDLAGDVVAIGAGVVDRRVGDAVFGALDGFRGGSVAERVAIGAGSIARRPAALSAEQAAAVPIVGMTALQALRDLAHVASGETVCVHGASGGLGTMVVQVARALGGVVTGVSSARNLDLVRSLGAVEALDYTRGEALARRWDVFIDCFGDHPYERVRGALAPRGRHVSVILRARAVLHELAARVGLGRARLVSVRSRGADLETLAGWLAAGTVRAVIDRTVPMADIVQAHRALESKRSRGKIVIAVS